MSDSDLLKDAREAFADSSNAMSQQRALWLEAARFAKGEQWPADLRAMREDPAAPRPCLTINLLPTHIRAVTNDIRQNTPAIKTRPVDSRADPEVAEVYDGVIRNIEYHSMAGPVVYATACQHQVTSGFGYFRIVSEYLDGDSGPQELYLRAIYNPLTVYPDEMSMCPVGSDMIHCFLVEELAKKRFQKKWPKSKTTGWLEGSEGDHTGWIHGDMVRVAEWYKQTERVVNMLMLDTGSLMSEEDYWKQYEGIEARPGVKGDRKRREKFCEWYKLTAHDVLERTTWPSRWIPVIRVSGEIVDIDGERTYKGLVYESMDPQRALNYHWSTYTEVQALQPKNPYIGADGSFDGHEREWDEAHKGRKMYVTYNIVDADGREIPPPHREAPPMPAAGALQGLQLANEAVKQTTGQFDPSLGNREANQSGIAINRLQKQSDRATYHFPDHMALAVEHAGRILIDVIPKFYDTERVARILGEDGQSVDYARLDPNQAEAVKKNEITTADGQRKVLKIYNLGIGKYDVVSTVGPSYSTKRQEGVDAMSTILQGNKELFQIIGDEWLLAQDWPGADKMAKRLKQMLPPQLKDQDEEGKGGVPPEALAKIAQMQQALQMASQALQQAGQQVQQLSAELAQAKAQAGDKDSELRLKAATENMDAELRRQELQIKAFEAQTERIKVLAEQSGGQESGEGGMGPEKPEKPERKIVRIVAPSGAEYVGEISEGGNGAARTE